MALVVALKLVVLLFKESICIIAVALSKRVVVVVVMLADGVAAVTDAVVSVAVAASKS